MSSYRGTGHARVNPQHPQAQAVCDRCGGWYNHCDLSWQFDYRGNALANLRILVCNRCMDKPQEQNRPVILGPDPIPIKDARLEQYTLGYTPQPPIPILQYVAED